MPPRCLTSPLQHVISHDPKSEDESRGSCSHGMFVAGLPLSIRVEEGQEGLSPF